MLEADVGVECPNTTKTAPIAYIYEINFNLFLLSANNIKSFLLKNVSCYITAIIPIKCKEEICY